MVILKIQWVFVFIFFLHANKKPIISLGKMVSNRQSTPCLLRHSILLRDIYWALQSLDIHNVTESCIIKIQQSNEYAFQIDVGWKNKLWISPFITSINKMKMHIIYSNTNSCLNITQAKLIRYWHYKLKMANNCFHSNFDFGFI